MIYEKKLDTFLAAAESGSFNKAAEKLYLTHTAVMKQIGQLEQSLGVKLFERSSHGLILTKAGRCLMEELPEYLKISQKIENRIRKAGESQKYVIRIGVSFLYPGHDFTDLWKKTIGRDRNFELQMVSISNDHKRYEGLNREYEVLAGPYNAEQKEKELLFLKTGEYGFSITLPETHPLAQRRFLRFSDLKGETLLIMKRGTSSINDEIRAWIEKNEPEIQMEDVDSNYDAGTFNRCAREGKPLLSLECWKKIHPLLVNVRLKEPWKMSYGIVMRQDAPPSVCCFFETVRNDLML